MRHRRTGVESAVYDCVVNCSVLCCGVGMVYDETQNYDNSFYVGGAMLLSGGLLLCLLHAPQLRQSAAGAEPANDGTAEQRAADSWSDVKQRRHDMTLTVRDKIG